MTGAAMIPIENVAVSALKNFPSQEADLTVFEKGNNVPFPVKRVFTIQAHEPVQRGRHAHKKCEQFLVCLAGSCEVTIDDGQARKTITLSHPNQGLHIPATVWAEQQYLEAGTILMVLCDQNYDEADYIREYDDFLAYRDSA